MRSVGVLSSAKGPKKKDAPGMQPPWSFGLVG